ncbi:MULTISPECIES: hypothetical protein [Pseudomonas]|jgi:hypothetical protein|uniref:Fis family transcriptional regulator n=1 Tax=Pseudomonas fluorescens TaxID=294 RepID=A0A5E7NQA2_PSEFL|nr:MULTISPECIES: hypothetical protein [Pseudomonas]KPG96605.1 hypothetical protein AK821_14980 [Pseudomonas sp. RIT-PI-r]MCP1487777.1 hypothetical protein [Pseudomonas fluorescens]VVP39535.1 hypothetical protein PS896_04781 [Pseudomonas fluorescens]
MPAGKRELARMERRLISTLTDACETAKTEIKGFTWLTHTADLSALAETLNVIWVFETLADRKLAQVEAKVRIFELTAVALSEAGIELKLTDRNVRFDSEQECQNIHGGDWGKRLKGVSARQN